MRFAALQRLAASLALLATSGVGCSGPYTRKVSPPTTEPPLISSAETPVVVAEVPPAPGGTFTDRHPLFNKPKQYYNSTNSNKVGKTAAATVVGIPAGFVGEIRQIVRGQSPGA